MGGSSLNSDLIFFGGEFVFVCVFCVVFLFPNVSKKVKNWIGGWVGVSLTNPSFSGNNDFLLT